MKSGYLLVALFFGLLVPSVFAAPIGYAVQSNGNQHLYRIDLSTGAAVDLGLENFSDAEGLSFVGNQLYGIGGTVNEFWNLTTPPGSKVGDTGTRNGIDAGLGYNRSTGVLYNLNGAFGLSSLYRVNIATGATTLVGSSTTFADNIAINSTGAAFALDAVFTNALYSVNLATGGMSLVGNLGISLSAQVGSDFDNNGVLWALMSTGAIYTINTATGAATFVANTLPNFEGLAISDVPEPATVLLMGLALGGLGARRRLRR